MDRLTIGMNVVFAFHVVLLALMVWALVGWRTTAYFGTGVFNFNVAILHFGSGNAFPGSLSLVSSFLLFAFAVFDLFSSPPER